MPSDPAPQSSAHRKSSAGWYSLWCGVCRRVLCFGDERLDVYAKQGWPQCCGEVMFCGPPTEAVNTPALTGLPTTVT